MAGLSEVADFNNEFDPTAWALYVRYQTKTTSDSEVSGENLLAGVAASVIVSLLIFLSGYFWDRRSLDCARPEKD